MRNRYYYQPSPGIRTSVSYWYAPWAACKQHTVFRTCHLMKVDLRTWDRHEKQLFMLPPHSINGKQWNIPNEFLHSNFYHDMTSSLSPFSTPPRFFLIVIAWLFIMGKVTYISVKIKHVFHFYFPLKYMPFFSEDVTILLFNIT